MMACNLDDLDTAELRAELIEALNLTAQHLIHASKVWVKFAARPDADLSEFRGGVFTYLPLIESGVVLAEIVYRFFGQDHLCKAVASLPVVKQKELLSVGAVPLAVFQNGAHTHRMVSLDDITKSQVNLIFDGPRIRPVEEQVKLLEPPQAMPWKRRPKRFKVGNVTVDREKGTVSITGGPAPVEHVVKALRSQGMIP